MKLYGKSGKYAVYLKEVKMENSDEYAGKIEDYHFKKNAYW